MSDHDDPELDRLVRASLGTRAGEVDTAVPVVARARAAARRRRTGWIAAGAAAAVAAVAVTAVVVDPGAPSGSDRSPSATRPTGATPSVADVPDDSRREYWRGVQVDVPADWGWGTAPQRTGVGDDDALHLCGGPGATRLPDGRRNVNPDPTRPYVGRPIMLSDLCVGGDALRDPEAPYVWLGTDLEPGVSDVGNGYTQATVEVAGTTVTVGTDDAGLRRRILASVAAGGPCRSSLDAPPVVTVTEAGDRTQPESLTVCAYRFEGDGTYSLVYGDVLDGAAAVATADLVAAAPVIDADCLFPEGGEWVTLSVGGDGWSRDYVVDLNCPAVTDPFGQMHRLEPATVRPWAVDGLPATLSGPYGGKGATFDSFIGLLG